MVEEVNVQWLENTAEVGWEDDADDSCSPAGLKEVDRGVYVRSVEE